MWDLGHCGFGPYLDVWCKMCVGTGYLSGTRMIGPGGEEGYPHVRGVEPQQEEHAPRPRSMCELGGIVVELAREPRSLEVVVNKLLEVENQSPHRNIGYLQGERTARRGRLGDQGQ